MIPHWIIFLALFQRGNLVCLFQFVSGSWDKMLKLWSAGRSVCKNFGWSYFEKLLFLVFASICTFSYHVYWCMSSDIKPLCRVLIVIYLFENIKLFCQIQNLKWQILSFKMGINCLLLSLIDSKIHVWDGIIRNPGGSVCVHFVGPPPKKITPSTNYELWHTY